MKISTFVSLFLGVSAGLTARGPKSAWAAPVGMAAQVKGSVSISLDGHKTPLRLLSRIEDGAAVTCGPNSGATIVLFGGGARYQIGPNSIARFAAGSVKGAKKLADLSGPSAGAVRLLGNARVGAKVSRQVISFQRLESNPTGLISKVEPQFAWFPIANASRYTFTLFDANDNVVWNTSTDQTRVAYPADAPSLVEKQPYLWKVIGFGTTGKALVGRWGFVTALSEEDARSLGTLATDLQTQAKATPADQTALLLLVEVYRSYGAMNLALELLETLEQNGEPGAEAAKSDLFNTLSPFARGLRSPAQPSIQ
jgi:hypothetical protein